MKKFLLTSLAVLGISGAASAAELPVRAPIVPPVIAAPSWEGFYVGFNGGYGWANSNVVSNPFSTGVVAGRLNIPGPTVFSEKLNGALFGFHGGYNFQLANWVLGIDGDYDWAGVGNSSQAVLPDPLLASGGLATDGLMTHTSLQWLATLRGRLGYAWGPSLFYVTGGGAWEKSKTAVLLSTDTSSGTFSTSGVGSFSNTRSGWVIGGGYEYMIDPNWIVRAEYLHYGFNGSSTFPVFVNCGDLTPNGCGSNVRSTNKDVDAIRLGLSYKFSWGAPAAVSYPRPWWWRVREVAGAPIY